LPPEASVLVLRLLTFRSVREEDGSTLWAYSDRYRGQASFCLGLIRAAGSGDRSSPDRAASGPWSDVFVEGLLDDFGW